MLSLRRVVASAVGARSIIKRVNKEIPLKKFYHSEEPTQPFDNLPFRVSSRYTLTLVFSLFFGVGLWAPFLIIWYSMAKRTM